MAVLDDIVLTDKQFQMIRGLVYDHCGINLHDGKKELVRARLAKRLRLGGFATFPEYMKHVFSDKTGKEFSILIDALSTNLTGFFREMQHFEFLSREFLPHLLERKRNQRDFKLRCWSAGCSSGEEPYSIAITLLEAVAGRGSWDVKVLATDISTTILERAQAGVYGEDRIKPVSPALRHKYLQAQTFKGEKVFTVGKPLRDVVIFKYLNLMKEWPIRRKLDFMFCRNVMIYFDKPTQEALINRYWDVLDSGGILFTGHSESLAGIDHKFKYIQPTIYIKP